jgi:TP901 family phage tail tape measure protein
MADRVLETVGIRVVALTDQLESQLTAATNRVKQFGQSASGAGAPTSALAERIEGLRNRSLNLRNDLERGAISTENFKRENQELLATVNQLTPGLDRMSREYTELAAVGGRAARGIATVEGRVSRLGISANIANGIVGSTASSLSRLGPAGQIASQGLFAVSPALRGISGAGLAAAAAIAGVTIAAAALSKRGIPELLEVQRAINILEGESGQSFANLRDDIDSFRDSLGLVGATFSRADIASALGETVKAGVDAADAFTLLGAATNVAAQGEQGLNESSELLLTNLRQFRLEVSEAARVTDVLTKANLLARGETAEFQKGLSTIGPVANLLNTSIEETTALLVVLDNVGLEAGERGATALRTAFTQLLDPTSKSRAELERLGVSTTDVSGKLRNGFDILKDMATALAGSETAAQSLAIIFDTRAVSAVAALSDAFADGVFDADRFVEAMKDSEGAAADFAEEMKDELEGAFERLKAATDNFAESWAALWADDQTRVTGFFARMIENLDRGLVDLKQFVDESNAILRGLDERFFGAQGSGGRGGSGPLDQLPSGATNTRFDEVTTPGGFTFSPTGVSDGPQLPVTDPTVENGGGNGGGADDDDAGSSSGRAPKTLDDFFNELIEDLEGRARLLDVQLGIPGDDLDERRDAARDRIRLTEGFIGRAAGEFGVGLDDPRVQIAVANLQAASESLDDIVRSEELLAREEARAARGGGVLPSSTAQGRAQGQFQRFMGGFGVAAPEFEVEVPDSKRIPEPDFGVAVADGVDVQLGRFDPRTGGLTPGATGVVDEAALREANQLAAKQASDIALAAAAHEEYVQSLSDAELIATKTFQLWEEAGNKQAAVAADAASLASKPWQLFEAAAEKAADAAAVAAALASKPWQLFEEAAEKQARVAEQAAALASKPFQLSDGRAEKEQERRSALLAVESERRVELAEAEQQRRTALLSEESAIRLKNAQGGVLRALRAEDKSAAAAFLISDKADAMEAADSLAEAGDQFRQDVIAAGIGFASEIAQGVIDGESGGEVFTNAAFGFLGSAVGLLPFPFNLLAQAGVGLFSGLAQNAFNEDDEKAAKERENRVNRVSAPSLTIEQTFNQNWSFAGGQGPAEARQVSNVVVTDALKELQRTLNSFIPRVERLEAATGVESPRGAV